MAEWFRAATWCADELTHAECCRILREALQDRADSRLGVGTDAKVLAVLDLPSERDGNAEDSARHRLCFELATARNLDLLSRLKDFRLGTIVRRAEERAWDRVFQDLANGDSLAFKLPWFAFLHALDATRAASLDRGVRVGARVERSVEGDVSLRVDCVDHPALFWNFKEEWAFQTHHLVRASPPLWPPVTWVNSGGDASNTHERLRWEVDFMLQRRRRTLTLSQLLQLSSPRLRVCRRGAHFCLAEQPVGLELTPDMLDLIGEPLLPSQLLGTYLYVQLSRSELLSTLSPMDAQSRCILNRDVARICADFVHCRGTPAASGEFEGFWPSPAQAHVLWCALDEAPADWLRTRILGVLPESIQRDWDVLCEWDEPGAVEEIVRRVLGLR